MSRAKHSEQTTTSEMETNVLEVETYKYDDALNDGR